MKHPLVLFLLFFLPACSLLEPVADDPVRHLLEAGVPAGRGGSSRVSIAVARPSLPPYLERVELVTRGGDGRLEIHEKHLWAEPLDAAVTRVVADNLRRLTGSADIQPSTAFIGRDYSALVEIRIERFDPLPDGSLVLDCTWKIQKIGGGEASIQSFMTTLPMYPPENTDEARMSARIVAMNQALENLARVIAKNL